MLRCNLPDRVGKTQIPKRKRNSQLSCLTEIRSEQVSKILKS